MDILFTDAQKRSGPAAFNIMVKPIGPVCNLNCSYCYYLEKKNLYPGKTDFRLDDGLLENFIRDYIANQDVPVVTFTWQGGEPTLLGIEYFENVIRLQKKYANGKTIENAFQTNGTRLNDEWCIFFKKNNILVGISIDGEEHCHDHFRLNNSGKPSFKEVMKGVSLLQKHKVDFNTLTVINSYNVRFALETYRFLKRIGSTFLQFIPIVERSVNKPDKSGISLVPPSYGSEATVTGWTVNASEFGQFMISIFDEWVRKDVGRIFVQLFDVTLANTVGAKPGLCVFSETCGDAMVMEHNGDLFTCDHFVYPEYFLGNISEKPMMDMVRSQMQFDFGINKRNSLPVYCLKCDVRHLCHGECPKHRFIDTPDGQAGLNYLCAGYKDFFHHTKPYMDFMAKELLAKRAPANVMNWIRNKESQVVKPVLPERNEACPCGSGKKFKNCCYGKPLYQF
ncbi:MAG: anaerobic sulfatase-maturation protein [Bacteroidales bacterium]|nr:anaerobic sulfatase-maturation protein [Bacteroidales bacterium]MCB8998981.1 anaerobic sulfatase-maturation protein [Bacteroidales bacterium]MCB9013732.1 anaerobic sulfatase-maturation protein [Bacteroidales bacterium]